MYLEGNEFLEVCKEKHKVLEGGKQNTQINKNIVFRRDVSIRIGRNFQVRLPHFPSLLEMTYADITYRLNKIHSPRLINENNHVSKNI